MPAPKATKEQLVHDLDVLGLTVDQIAEKYGYRDYASVWRALKYRGVPYPNRYVGNKSLTPEQVQVVIGTMLGDGYIPRTNGRHTFMRISQCLAQEAYVVWKMEILGPWMRAGGIRYEVNKRWNVQLAACTYNHPVFDHYREMFYPDGHKHVSIEILNMLEPLGLAVWFMDDGSYLTGRKCRIHTAGFTMDENRLIQTWFQDRWGIECKVGKISGGYPVLTFYADNFSKLSDLIKPHLLPSMQYKLGLS